MTLEKRPVTRFELLMDAGYGAQKAGDILLGAFVGMGQYVYVEPMIPAEISPPARSRPALSGVIIRLADFDVTNIGNDTDLILASHEVVLDRRLDDNEFNPSAKILLDMRDQPGNPDSYEMVLKRCTKLGLSVIPFNVDEPSQSIIKELGGKGLNLYYLGMLSYIYNMDEEIVQKEIVKTFGKKLKEDIMAKNISLYHNGYQLAKEKVFFRVEVQSHPSPGEHILIDGNTSMSMGIIDAGFKLFSGYPITPASSIMHTLAKSFPSYGGMVHQAEDEIAAIGTAVGAYYAGMPALTATSGPGLSLKQEFIGFASATEIPLVVVDVQRGGPSTGMPTKTEQSDLLAALCGSHGDYAKVIISVSNVIDCFYAPHLARYLAEKLRVPVFIMSDFQTANSYKVVSKFKLAQMNGGVDNIPDFVLERFHMKRLEGAVQMVRGSQTVPGTEGGMRRITGINTDENGKINYFSDNHQRSHALRNEKIHHVRRALTLPEMFGKESNDVLIVGWGSSRGAIEEAITLCEKNGVPASGMHMRVVYPLPLMLKDVFARYKKVMTVEVAYGDKLKPSPLALLLRSETLKDVHPLIADATGRPLRPRIIMNKIQEVLK
ncbi:MAG: 2-oxoacid:acceptor oxidoreductase family protein [Candidatus Omnitrophica bacterium]|nr:2-oxoacid:acceptor oxidoreductase family protein [Candidatus Omnitrophota bacterium]MDE2222579.1 2-oxoacid:acceptor oxidoreductase family protein [Candidatus Omnitrophota bacterium]